MSNYPDDFRCLPEDGDTSRHVEDSFAELEKAHEFVNECLQAIAAVAVKHRILILSKSFELVGDAICDEIVHDEYADTIKSIHAEGYDASAWPENFRKLCENASEVTADALRIKPLDVSGILSDMFRPRAVLTNPQTHADIAQANQLAAASFLDGEDRRGS